MHISANIMYIILVLDCFCMSSESIFCQEIFFLLRVWKL